MESAKERLGRQIADYFGACDATCQQIPLKNGATLERQVPYTLFGLCAAIGLRPERVLAIGGGDGRVVRFDENSRTYGTNPIRAYWMTPRMDLGSKLNRKQLLELYLEAKGTGLAVTTCCDTEITEKSCTLPSESAAAAVELPLHGQGRHVQLNFSNPEEQWFAIEDGVELLCDVQRRPL